MTLDGRPIEEDALSAYLDDELDADARAAVDARLAASAEWRAILDELRETRAALRAMPAVDGPPQFWSRVLAGDDVVDLDAERARRRRGWRVAITGAAAAIAVIVVGAALVPQRDRVKPSVATFADQHAARASFDSDALSQLASVGIQGLQR
jgi:anti-sigma factor RsiW